MKILLPICLLFCAINLYGQSQDTIILKRFRQMELSPIIMWSSAHHCYLYKIGNGELAPIGIRGSNIEPFLLQVPAAKKAWKKSRRSSTLTIASSLAAIAGVIIAFSESSSENRTDNGNTLRNIGIGAGIVFTPSIFIFHKRNHKQFEKAVDKFNKAQY